MLPTFLIIGAQKAATTSLYEYLDQHSDVFMARPKEINFFVDEGTWHRGQHWYESRFEGAGSARQRGEASPGYTFFPFYREAPERAARLVPDARIIYVIRHPVDRMVSSWAQHVGSGIEDLDLEQALLYQANYALVSCYWLQISRWAAHFPREQILVLRSEDLASDPGAALDRVLTHLDLDPGWRPDNLEVRYNRTEEKRIARAPVRRVASLARRAGHGQLATALGPRKLRRLSRPMVASDVTLAPDVTSALMEIFRADFALLRQFVGPELDLWGLA